MNPKYEPCISKIERVMAISVSQGKTKSQKFKFFKSRYLAEFLRQGPKILHVIITFLCFKITFSNMGPKTTPSLISKEEYQIPPPSVGRNQHPLGNRVKNITTVFYANFHFMSKVTCVSIFTIPIFVSSTNFELHFSELFIFGD